MSSLEVYLEELAWAWFTEARGNFIANHAMMSSIDDAAKAWDRMVKARSSG